MRIGEACRAAAAQLRAAGVPDPAWDSGQLMSRVTGLAPLMARLSERELTAEEAAAFDALVQRRVQRVRTPLICAVGAAALALRWR